MEEETGRAWPPWRRAEVMQRWRGACRGQEEEKRTLWVTERCAEEKYHQRANTKKETLTRKEQTERRERGRDRERERERDGEKCPDVTSSEGVQPHGPTLINKVTQR